LVEMSDVFTNNHEVLVAHANARLNLYGRRLLVARVIADGRPVAHSPRSSACRVSARTDGWPGSARRATPACSSGPAGSVIARVGPRPSSSCGCCTCARSNAAGPPLLGADQGGRVVRVRRRVYRRGYGWSVRWELLFEDLESQLETAQAADRVAERADMTRAERATVTLTDRLRAARGRPVVVRLGEGLTVAGELLEVVGAGSRRMLVPVTAIVAIEGLGPHAAPCEGEVMRKLGLGHALRALARDRALVRVVSRGVEVTGRVDRVGADHLDLAVGPEGTRVGGVLAVPFASLQVVRSG
jgi:hypothetical protein